MKIGIDARMYSSKFTGIGRYAYELINNLAKIDAQSEYVVFLNPPEYADFVPPGKNFKAVQVNAKHYSVAEQTSLLTTLMQARLDLMHFTHFNAPIFYRKPFVVTIHDLTLSFFPGRKMTSPVHRFAYQHVIKHAIVDSQKIIAVSEHTKKDIRKIYPVADEKIIVTHEGIGEEFIPAISDQRSAISENIKHKDFAAPLSPSLSTEDHQSQGGSDHLEVSSSVANKSLSRTRSGRGRGDLNPNYQLPTTNYLLYTGVWREHKNLKRLMKAYLQLQKNHRSTCRLPLAACRCMPDLVITGKHNPLYTELLTMPETAGFQNRVRFIGHVTEKELVSLYQNALAFVFPSLYEGFGLPPLEAMACGTPVVCSNASSLPEVCADAALYFDPLSVTDITEKLERIITDEDLRTELVRKGLGNVRRFSWKTMAERTLVCYSQESLK